MKEQSVYELIINNKDQLYRIAFSYLKNEQDALEAIQETTFRAYKNHQKLKDQDYAKTWIIRILINYCIDELKKRKKIVYIEDKQIKQYSNINNDKLEVEMALNKINPKYKHVIILKYFEDLKIKEVSRILKKPEGTIKTWLNKALKELKNILNEEEI